MADETTAYRALVDYWQTVLLPDGVHVLSQQSQQSQESLARAALKASIAAERHIKRGST